MAEADYEKLGVFYLGRRYDLQNRKLTTDLCLYDSKDLLTHAICIGMTGSGKTGLCLGLIEEAAIDNIPVIAIDPKGDIGNLLLTFPQLRGEDFEPWVDGDQARRQGESLSDFANQQAQMWREGLADWEETGERIARLKTSAEFTIYTPGASSGLPISIVRSFAAPPPAVMEDPDSLRDRISSATSSLLALLGIAGDPLRSREHILLSNILKNCWQSGQDLTLAALIQAIQKPPISQIGALDLETFYPAKERFELAMTLNNLLASPEFEAWTQGESLDIDHLLYTAEGKPRVSILSISHLDDSQRMFFVSMLLNQLIAWMRGQSGTSSLRAIFYMDEMFGYFPPTANPPSKTPLLTLMKQARAFGLGVVLATQNPVDIDYKGLSNAGTWLIGRLQTERDKMRVLDGLEGAAADTGSSFNRASMDKLLSQLSARVFLVNNVHDKEPIVMQSRWTLCYLRGPLTRDQIRSLMIGPARSLQAKTAASVDTAPPVSAAASRAKSSKPIMPPGIAESFLPIKQAKPLGATLIYKPRLFAVGNVRFADTKAAVDTTLQYSLLATGPSQPSLSLDWDQATAAKVWIEQLKGEPEENPTFEPLPLGLSDAKSYKVWSKEFANWLYNTKRLKVLQCGLTGDISKPRESERDFRIRLTQSAREQRDAAAAELQSKYAPKLANLQEKLRRAQQAVERRQTQARDQQMQSAISVGATVLGAFMGRRKITSTRIEQAATAARKMGRASRGQQSVDQAQETVQTIADQLTALNADFANELACLKGKFDPQQLELTEVSIGAKKTNITVPLLALVWAPYIRDAGGHESPAWLPLQAPGSTPSVDAN
jgi:hypothetical protein